MSHQERLVANELAARARQALPSPGRPGSCLSRAELAEAVNAALDIGGAGTTSYVDARWITKLERGEVRWPNSDRRAALRLVLDAASDADLGMTCPPRIQS